ncbi:hypothetical protein [Actinosynnema sp.]|uniref:hypothetical protein n=1 Tax=Actinosynnema sp. TaxID=1872144 RepID=UPI003F86F324
MNPNNRPGSKPPALPEQAITSISETLGVSTEALHAMSHLDVAIGLILTKAETEILTLANQTRRAGQDPGPIIVQTIAALHHVSPFYVHERMHRATTDLLNPPTNG